MRKVVAERISAQVSDWAHRGLIDDELSARLKDRYSNGITMGSVLLRWLGFLAVLMLGMSVVGFVGMVMGEVAAYIAPFLIAALAFFLWLKGTQLASDPAQRYPTSGAVLVTVGLIAGFAALVIFYEVFGGRGMQHAIPVMMLMVGAAAFFTAYRFGLRWPLILGVLLAFHALGNMHRYGGHGSYFLGIQDERLTFGIAIVSIVFGMWHEKVRETDLGCREIGFGQIYIVTGLLYANLSLWILSIPGGELFAVLLFSAGCVVQIALGGRFHDGRFTGFGIVFLSINIYTRLFENFWDDLSKGGFFLISGAIALIVGSSLEFRARKLKAASEL